MIGEVLITTALCVVVARLYKKAYERPPNFPKGPPRLPVYGSYWFVLYSCYNNLATAFTELGKKYNTGIVGLYLGSFPSVIVNDPKLVREMLFTETLDGRMDIILGRLRSWFKRLGIFFTDNYFWHVQRRFSLRYMRDYGFGRRDDTLESVIQGEIKEMIDMALHGPKYPAEHNIVKGDQIYLPNFFAVPFINGMLQVFARMTLPRKEYHKIWDMANGGLLFQRSSDDLGRALSITPWLKDVLPNFSGYNALRKGNSFFTNFYKNLIDKVKEDHDESHDRHFLDMYIRKMKEEQRDPAQKTTFSEEQLIMICTDYTFPAATALGMVLTMLIERILLQDGIQEKIHKEIDTVVGRDRAPTLDDRKDMPYTEACIREMMRFDTIVPLGIPHRATEDITFGGHYVPEGCLVSANYVPLHTDKEIWGDPEVFRPERFIENNQLKVANDKSLPFGAGRRLCAGETYARQCLFVAFASFMQVFKVSTADGKKLTKPSERMSGIITTIPEFWVKVTPRTEKI